MPTEANHAGRNANLMQNWDKYFHNLCVAVASKSSCLSRQIGAILVKDKSVVSTGYNGPARGYPHCEGKLLYRPGQVIRGVDIYSFNLTSPICPRHAKGYKSGEGLEECPAAHAERNCISNAARLGVAVLGCTLYMNCVLPCKDCATSIVNAGIVEVVVDEAIAYDSLSIKILTYGGVRWRVFDL